jgi:hypothetical protein
MSVTTRQIRKNSNAQSRFHGLVSDIKRAQAEQVKIDNTDFRVRNRVMYSKLLYHDPHVFHKNKPSNQPFYMTFEPDLKYLVGMWDLDHTGRFSMDGSCHANHGKFLNNTTLGEGIDLGFGTSQYVDFDGRECYVYVDDKPELRLSQADQFSISFRLYPRDIEASDGPGGNKFRMILHKPDTSTSPGGTIDSGVADGYACAVTPDGKIRFTVKLKGISYSAETLAGVIVPNTPPTAYSVIITVNMVNTKPVPLVTFPPPDTPGGNVESESPLTPPLIAPRIEINVNNEYFQIYTTEHLHFIADPNRRLRFGAVWNYNLNDPGINQWFKFKGGIQQMRMYRNLVLTFPNQQALFINKLATNEMPFGSPALAGQTLVFQEPGIGGTGGYDEIAFEFDAYETGGSDFFIYGFPGFDPLGFDIGGYDTLFITEQGTIQLGGFDPRGFSFQGFSTIPQSQS